MDKEELRQRLDHELAQTMNSVNFWREQTKCHEGTPFERVVGRTVQSYKAQAAALLEARKLLDDA